MSVPRCLLVVAAALVPGPRRAEWLAEWRAELDYVPARLRTAFCLGAYKDALWMRWNTPMQLAYLASPWRCLAMLAVLAALSAWLAVRLPVVREALFPFHYPDARALVTLSGVPWYQYQFLAGDEKGVFSQAAFYKPLTARADRGNFAVAVASRNLFDVLGIHVTASTAPGVAALILDERAWRYSFDHDPHIVGRRITIAGQAAQVTAVVSNQAWALPGHADAWLLVDDPHPAALPESDGYVAGRLASPAAFISLRNQDGNLDRYRSMAVSDPHPLPACLLVVAMACLILPSVTSLSLGGYPPDRHCTSTTVQVRRWLFLAAKIVLVVPIAVLGSFDLLSFVAPALQPHAVLVGTVIGFRWVLIDQRRRCPVCLRVLTNPTSIGQPSRTFLDWYGTELICRKGHGLLHVPEISNSYSSARWLDLDSSWSGLF